MKKLIIFIFIATCPELGRPQVQIGIANTGAVAYYIPNLIVKHALACHGIDWIVDVAKFIETNPDGYRLSFYLYIDGRFRPRKTTKEYFGDKLMDEIKELADYIETNRLPLLTGYFVDDDPHYYCVTPLEMAHNFRTFLYERYGNDLEQAPIMGLGVNQFKFLYHRARQKFSDEEDIKKEMLRELNSCLEYYNPKESTLDYGITTDYFILDEEERSNPKNLGYIFRDCSETITDSIDNDTIK